MIGEGRRNGRTGHGARGRELANDTDLRIQPAAASQAEDANSHTDSVASGSRDHGRFRPATTLTEHYRIRSLLSKGGMG